MRVLVAIATLAVIAICSLGTARASQEDSAEQSTLRALRQLEKAGRHYETGFGLAGRARAIRLGLLKSMRIPTAQKGQPSEIRHSRREYAEYTVENLAIESMPGFYCTGNLYRPKCQLGQRPAILLPAGHFPPFGRTREAHQVLAIQLARMGAIVFAYSMVGWDDSIQTSHMDPLVPALQTWNSVRAIDYLLAMKEVDRSRIGIAGASGGGTQAIYATIVDKRICASVAVAIVYPWSWFSPSCICETGMGLMRDPETNMVELAATIAPRPLLLVSCGWNSWGNSTDPTSNFLRDSWPFISRSYLTAGAPTSVRSVHLREDDHDYGPSTRAATYEFFAAHLGIERKAEVLEQITIEGPEALVVFDADHPMPGGALRGEAEIAAGFELLVGGRR